jgi:hypothetical protein
MVVIRVSANALAIPVNILVSSATIGIVASSLNGSKTM